MPSPFAILEILACSLISFLPYMLLIVYPFRKHLRFGNGLTVTLTIFAAIIQLVCDLAVGMKLMPNTSTILIATLVIHVLLSLVLIRMPFGKKLFAQLAAIGSAVVLSTASKYLTNTLFPDASSGMFRWIFLLMLIALQAVILVPYALMVVKQETVKPGFPWSGLLLIPAAALAVWVYTALPGFSSLQLIFLVVIPLNIFAILAFRNVLHNASKQPAPQIEEAPAPKAKPAKKAAAPKEQPVLQPAAPEEMPAPKAAPAPAPKKAPAPKAVPAPIPAAAPRAEVKSPIQQTLTQDHLTQLQSLQHDSLMLRITESDQFHRELRRHVDAMAYRLDRKQIEKLQLHIRSLQEQLSGEDENTFCDNRELNTVMTYYNRMAGYCGTMVTAAMQVDEKPPVDVEDLTVLLGNLLDNALEACGKQSSRDRRIFTALRMNGTALYLTVENTYDSPIQKSASGRYLSTKHSGYGVGLEVCEQIVARHNGTLELNDFNGIFKATAILRP